MAVSKKQTTATVSPGSPAAEAADIARLVEVQWLIEQQRGAIFPGSHRAWVHNHENRECSLPERGELSSCLSSIYQENTSQSLSCGFDKNHPLPFLPQANCP